MPTTPNIKRMLGTSAIAVTLAASAGATFLAGAGTALAPEAATLRETLRPVGYPSIATYVDGTPATIIRWPASASANHDGSPAAGQPCTTNPSMGLNSQTKQVIVVSGSTRLCH
jgi:hypothetical protein